MLGCGGSTSRCPQLVIAQAQGPGLGVGVTPCCRGCAPSPPWPSSRPSTALHSGSTAQGKPGDEAWSDPEAHFPEEVVMGWFCQLLLALHHLHCRHIIHR